MNPCRCSLILAPRITRVCGVLPMIEPGSVHMSFTWGTSRPSVIFRRSGQPLSYNWSFPVKGMPDRSIRRVLMTTDTVGGVWTFTLELAQQLSKLGIEVVMAALGRAPNPQQISDAGCVLELIVLTSDFKLEWMEEPWSDVEESGRWLLHLEREYRPDIVHLNSFGHGDLPWSAPVILTAHSCVLSWWAAVKKGPAPDAWGRYHSVVTRSG